MRKKKQPIDAYETYFKTQELSGLDWSTQFLREHGFHFYCALIYAWKKKSWSDRFTKVGIEDFNPRNTSAFSVLEFEYRDTENRAKRVPFSRNSVDPQTETWALRVVWGA